MTDISKINLTPKTLEDALETLGHLAKIVIELKEENAQLKEENIRLKEQLNTNSKNSSLPPSRDRKRLRYFKAKLLRHLRSATRCPHKPAARTCTNIWESVDSLWSFFDVPHVPPTNNHAERQFRPLVISKKLTFGTQSERGSRFIERMFSVVATCKQQEKELLTFITDALLKSVETTKNYAPLQGA